MTRMRLARSLPMVLLGLAATLTLIVAVALLAHAHTRDRYERALGSISEVDTTTAEVLATRLSAGAVRDDPAAGQVATQRLLAVTRDDPRSLALARRVEQGDSSAAVRSLARRQRARRQAARSTVLRDRRTISGLAAAAAALSLLITLALALRLIHAVRRSLDALVAATDRVGSGAMGSRVPEDGPPELRALGAAFNVMTRELEDADRSLRHQRLHLAQVIESLGDAIVVCDAEGRVSQANPRARELLPELELGASVDDPPSPLPPRSQAIGAEREIEHDELILAVTAARLGTAEADGVVYTVRDVSERARLERLKTEFVATASHELRSPLTSIKGFVELLEASSSLTPKQREFVEIILLSTDRLGDLVADLLDVARMEAGRLEISRRPVALLDVVQEVTALMGPRIADAGQALELDLPADLPQASADAARVRQIITNLLTNAHLYTPEGGTVGIRLAATDTLVSVAIADTGRGMEAEQVERIFDRFYRAGEQTDRGPSGSGLGLSIVRSLVELHDGTIDVTSAPGEGTTFTVALPRAAPVGNAAHLARLRGKRVLVVDDDPDIAQLIATQLAPWGVLTEVVASGEEAVARLRAKAFDAVTLDILMQGMTGFDVLEALRGDPELADLPVVVVSVFSTREALAGEWVVSKPIDADELTAALGSALEESRARVLVLGDEAARERIGAVLAPLDIEHDGAGDAAQAQARCVDHRYEVAVVDAGLPDLSTAVAGLDLRGRRERRSVIVVSGGDGGAAAGLARLDGEPVDLEHAGAAVLSALGRRAEE